MISTTLLEQQVKCLPKQWLIFILVAMLTSTNMAFSEDQEQSRYDKAWALYQQGPQRAHEVIALLQEEIKENPDNASAHLLLGITFFGTERFDAALRQINTALDLGEKQNVKRPRTILLKARTLKMLRRSGDAIDLLDENAALFSEKDTKNEYDVLYTEIANEKLKIDLEMTSEAIRIAGAILKQDLINWLAIPLAQKEWRSLTADKDLFQFLTVELDVPDLATFVLFPTESQTLPIAIYFSQGVPIGYLRSYSDETNHATKQTIGYVPLKGAAITPNNYAKIEYEIGSIESDNGIKLKVFKIKTIDQKD